MDSNRAKGKWEKRWHPLRGEWVVYSAHRNTRPWSFEIPETKGARRNAYEPECYLCPGNPRVSGQRNPNYDEVFIFDNDHPVVGPDAPEVDPEALHGGLYRKAAAKGISRVVCFHPRHDLTLASIPHDRAARVFIALRDQMIEMIGNAAIRNVLIFENKGEITGVSNPHPHCQIYATDFTFTLVEKELVAANDFRKNHSKNIFDEIMEAEKKDGIRIIAENDGAIAFIPYFARYAYEVMIFPKKRHVTLATMRDEELGLLAGLYREVIQRFDMIYEMEFPYVMSLLQAPVDGGEYDDYHLHMLIQPPLRQPGLMKYLAGPEIGGGNFMADTLPEEKAAELRAIDITNYDPDRFFA